MPESQAAGTDEAVTPEVTVISPSGNLLIEAADERRGHVFLYRADAATLRQTSAYFDRLLDPTKFGEGTAVSGKLAELRKRYGNIVEVPDGELPRVRLSDIGRTSKVNSIHALFSDFLTILHGQELSATQTSAGALVMPLPNVANIAVVADRFDALPCVSAYIRRKRILEAIDGRRKSNKSLTQPEERLRQKLMIGVLFERSSWVSSSSQSLVVGGSARWVGDAPDSVDLPMWWDLPHGLEGEYVN